jgi:hypothetical protein
MAIKDSKGRWIDSTGVPIPTKYIDKADKRRDALVEKTYSQALKLQQQLKGFKMIVSKNVQNYLDWLASENGEESLNPGGNYTLKTFAGDKQIMIKINKVIEFDERLQLAKQKIDKCLERWSEGGNDNLKVVVFDAFKVDRKGNVDTRRILSLRRLKIKDKYWLAAMDLISEAVSVTGTRRYLMIQFKENAESEWQTLRLDLAGV